MADLDKIGLKRSVEYSFSVRRKEQEDDERELKYSIILTVLNILNIRSH